MITDSPKKYFSEITVWKISIFDKGPKKAKNALQKNEAPSDPNFGKRISGNIFDHKEDSLGIILSPISGL